MKLTLYQVDAFTNRVFSGNPAAVCPLDSWLNDSTLQAIATENNLSDTAYFVQEDGAYHLRWFTPTTEVDLCGHATLAAAHVLRECLDIQDEAFFFDTLSGRLTVQYRDGKYAMDLPSRPAKPCEPVPALIDALGREPDALLSSVRDHLAVFSDEDTLASLKPDMSALADIDMFAVICTAAGKDVDFVSRFFAPRQGIPEDPVTGSAHATLTPYWADRLGKSVMRARQVSARGGELWCEQHQARVTIAGDAVLFMQGTIDV